MGTERGVEESFIGPAAGRESDDGRRDDSVHHPRHEGHHDYQHGGEALVFACEAPAALPCGHNARTRRSAHSHMSGSLGSPFNDKRY